MRKEALIHLATQAAATGRWMEIETNASHITVPVDALVRNSAIWKTDTPATCAAVKRWAALFFPDS